VVLRGFHHTFVWICLPDWAYNAVFLHDSPYSFQVIDNIKLACQCHFNLAGSFFTVFKFVCFQNYIPEHIIIFALQLSSFNRFLGVIVIVAGTRDTSGLTKMADHVSKIILFNNGSDENEFLVR
jgi:hypothetical protein